MSKGQRRSNREIRKPKKEKVEQKPETSFASQVKDARQPDETKARAKPRR